MGLRERPSAGAMDGCGRNPIGLRHFRKIAQGRAELQCPCWRNGSCTQALDFSQNLHKSMTPLNFFDLPTVSAERAEAGKLYKEFIRVPLLSVGVYVLPAGATDPQRPHREDEAYYVVRGRARMRVGTEEQVVKSGSVIFVPGSVEHRFFDISEELEVLVFFA